jgi:hypothetical protein
MDTLSPQRIAQETNDLLPPLQRLSEGGSCAKVEAGDTGWFSSAGAKGTAAPSPDPVGRGIYRGLLLLSHSPTFLVQTIGFL